MIYTPPVICREKVDVIFPWMGKEWKVKEIPYRGNNMKKSKESKDLNVNERLRMGKNNHGK